MESKKNVERAEDYINSLINTMMTTSAVLATISVAILGIINNMPSGLFKILIVFCVLISATIFIFSFWLGIKSHGSLILAVKSEGTGLDYARSPISKFLKTLIAGLIFLGLACLLFFTNALMGYLKLQPAPFNVLVTEPFKKILITSGYGFIMLGSIGMICFAIKFPLSTKIKDLELIPERLFRFLNGYQVWKWSWIFIIIGSIVQIIMIWMA